MEESDFAFALVVLASVFYWVAFGSLSPVITETVNKDLKLSSRLSNPPPICETGGPKNVLFNIAFFCGQCY
jgi:hypothetical protein